jgi:hypothetical protein
MAKSDLQVFVEMNEADTKNKTANLVMGLDLVESKKVKAGTIVSMGIAGDMTGALFCDEVIPVLLLVNRAEYKKLKSK